MNRKIAFCLIAAFILTNLSAAATLNVPIPYSTIEAAIGAAAASGDIIEVNDGSYTPISVDGFDFGGKLIRLKSKNGPQNCTINCNNTTRAFYFNSGEISAAIVEGFTIKNGNAYYGGAIECEINCSPTIKNCIITNNAAVYGGAIDCYSFSSPLIQNCIITNNTSDFDGGAIECDSQSSPDVNNCLIAENSAGLNGGAIDCYDVSLPKIRNCTIANNIGDANRGGIYADAASKSTIRNSILWNNGDDIYGLTDVNYSCIQNGDAGTGNISINPLFRQGPRGNYYLSQIAAGQLKDSNCIDKGSATAAGIFGSGHTFVTRTDNVPDSGTVDLGFHYSAAADVNCTLIAIVDPNGNYGTLAPNYPAPGLPIKRFAQVSLHATPDVNYHVVKWTGTNDDNSTDVNNIVTMDANHTVTVKFSSTLNFKLTTAAVDSNGSIDQYSAQPFIQHTMVDINAYPHPGYVVKKWFKGNAATFNINDANIAYDPCSNPSILRVQMESDTKVAVQFGPNSITHLLNTSVVGGAGGHGTINPKRSSYPEGMIVQLTAAPDTHYKVKQWTGTYDDNSVALTNTVIMNTNKNVTVEFEPTPQYQLTVHINDPNKGSVDPNGGWFDVNSIVTLTALPAEGYRVRNWAGDANTWNRNTYNVTMDANKDVNLFFEDSNSRVIHVFGDVNGIQDALNQAQNGDTIQIHPGTYNIATGFAVTKAVTMVGDPEHPENVILDYMGESTNCINIGDFNNPASTLVVTFNGFTIQNYNLSTVTPWMPPESWSGAPGLTGFTSANNYGGGLAVFGSHIIKNCIIKDCAVYVAPGANGLPGHDPNEPNHPYGGNGGNGGNAGGAGIYIDFGNPTIKNVRIENCIASAGDGGNGAIGWHVPDKYPANYISPWMEPDRGNSGNGGNGGSAFGAGIDVNSGNPTFINVTVNNCTAISGNGGIGANGATDVNGADGGLPGETHGAGIYCSANSKPVFVNCTINDCRGYSGKGGDGGNAGPAVVFWWSGGYGGLTTDPAAGQGDLKRYTTKGGGVFCDAGSNSQFINCTIRDNIIYGSISGIGGIGTSGIYQSPPRKNYRLPAFGAGVFCSTASSADFNSCLFSGNRTAYNSDFEDPNYLNLINAVIDVNNSLPYEGEYTGMGGGLCLWYVLSSDIHECNFTLNSAPIGGGIYTEGSDTHISDSNVINNISMAGGGVLTLEGFLSVRKSTISGNIAGTVTGIYPDTGGALFGTGGGIYALSTYFDINDTLVTDNYAKITGAGICLDGDNPIITLPRIKNCLITANTAGEEGGGIAAIFFAEPKIMDCTITDNAASNGGGLFATYAANVIVKDSIFWNNSGTDGSQIALSDGGPFTDMPANVNISYSDIDLRYIAAADLPQSESDSGTTGGSVLVESQTIYSQINSSGSAKVIVTLVEPAEAQLTNWSSPASVSELRTQIAMIQNQALATLTSGEWTLRHKLTNVAAFSGQINLTGLNKLLNNPLVAHIEPVRLVYPALAQGIPLMNAMDTRGTYNGQGISVAIVDSGVDYTHPRLGGGGFPNSKVIGGYDTGGNDADPMPVGEAHGTCCAGIAAGLLGTVGDYIGGVAYNAKIYALKLVTDAGEWPTDSTLAAWDWCISHRNDDPANPIKVTSNSWGMPYYPINSSAEADALSPAHTLAAQTAVNAGITILAASGNDGFAGEGISWPAAMSNVISVGAVYDAAFISPACGVQTQPDQVTCYSNTADILDILAPSENAYTTTIGGGYNQYFNGTSAACPYAAGAVAAIQSAAMQLNGSYLTPAQIRALLKLTGDPVTDTKVAITKPRVNVGAAIALMSESTPVYSEAGCTITGLTQDANDIWVIDDHNNIYKDPNFVLGYYLSSIANQGFDSPCFDIGSDLAANLGLSTYTTRTDGIFDSGIVDLGYHYFEGLPSYPLTIGIDVNDANGRLEVVNRPLWTPGNTYNVYAGDTVSFHAIPDVNTRVSAWILDGQVNQTHNLNFSVVMNAPHSVAVRFEPYKHIPRNLIVPDEYENIQDAIDATEDGDTIYIFRKSNGLPHYIGDPCGLNFNGKAITIRSENPLDPNIVAATIIDCDFSGRAFIFQNGEKANSIVEGLTIINSLSAGAIAEGTRPNPIDANLQDGIDAAGNGFGGAVFIGRNTSPIIRNCVFSNCRVAGGIGSDGADGFNLFGQDDQRSRGGSGGHGGNGSGNGYGGTIYCDQNSSPTILNCQIINSAANGGIGGDGGNGGDGTSSKIGGNGGNGGNGSGNGYGGAIYVVRDAKPKFIGCSFAANSALMGITGSGGVQGSGQIPTQPPYAYDGIDGQSSGDGYAGVIYYEKGSAVDINDCSLIDNNSIMDGGAIYCEPNCSGISIFNANISGNRTIRGNGGAILFGVRNKGELTDCYFGGNITDGNGGALFIGSLTDSNLCRFNFNNCAFTDNISGGIGGAISARNIEANFIDCYINRNTATSGGGLHIVSDTSKVKIYGGTIMKNKAIGTVAEGGGTYISNLPLEIVNCQVSENTSNYSGAGLMLKGPGTTTSKVHNCLFFKNSATVKGGALFVSLNSSPKITSCTFSENKCQGGGAGSAILCAYTSSPTIKDCIFDQMAQIAIYEGGADCDPKISYCLFNKNNGDFYDYDLNKTYDTNSGDPNINLAALNPATDGNNVTGNPVFLASDLGKYYLGQLAGQTMSQAVDRGSADACSVSVLPDDNMANYTTRTDSNNLIGSQGDMGKLDIGFHYIDIDPNKPRRFRLTTTVLGGHGSILPPDGNYYAGSSIELTALPDPGWRVRQWTGTDDDGSTNAKNNVVLIRNKAVTVSFERPRNLYVPAEYTSLQDAINAARDGDKIILAKGTYYGEESDYDWTQFRIINRNFTITGTNPDDPNIVAQIILLGNGFYFLNVDNTMVLDGITIQDAHYHAGPNARCSEAWEHGPGGDGINGNSIEGCALTLNYASPTIRNCRFVRCSVNAALGCDGTGDWGDGGWAGYAWGGAAFIDSTSNPIFKNCSFIDCFAQGSNGMNGGGRWGHGGNWGDPNGGPFQTWDFGPYNDPAYYSGYGGAVYCMGGSKPQFEKCLFQGNRSYGGVCGISGTEHVMGYPMEHYAIDTFGGAVYLASGSVATFISCDFNDNEAHTRGQLGNHDANVPNIMNNLNANPAVLYDPAMSYGGAICAEGTAIPILKDCTFTNNRACAGGGMYWEDSIAHISRNNFRSNTAMLGGGVVLVDSNSIFFESDFSGNEAVEPIGQGGAIYCVSSDARFYDCEISNNTASTSGGGAYFSGELEPNMHNCLITHNTAGRDGGGISANWDVGLSLSVCTVAHNTATSYGGGLSCAYQANTNIINSIFWSGRADYGPEISIGSDFDAADKLIAGAAVSYSDVAGGAASVFVDADHGCTLNWDYTSNLAGTTLTNPLFIPGDWGDYYLSQLATSDPLQTKDSNCVDAGFDTAINNDMYRHTTRTDNVMDIADSNVDMGYHYTLTAEITGDFNFDGIVNEDDFILFQQYWMDSGCTFPYFCHGRDLNEDGQVDFEDFALFAENYGLLETTPPKPNPSTWAQQPHSAGDTVIAMRATKTKDNSGSLVEYYFDETTGNPGATDSGWITSPDYNDSGLTKGVQYGYKVKARDARHNETGWSTIGYAVAGEDVTPPQPDPMEWLSGRATSQTSIQMVAKVATDDSGGVEYFFDCTSPGCHDCNDWQASNIYDDTGLEPNTAYTYRVKARDASDNQTGYSDPCTVITVVTGRLDPDPSTWATVPQVTYDGIFYHHYMVATITTADNPPVQYYFESTDQLLKSGWISEPNYTTEPLNGPSWNTAYRVKTRDSANPPNESGWSQWYHLLDGPQ